MNDNDKPVGKYIPPSLRRQQQQTTQQQEQRANTTDSDNKSQHRDTDRRKDDYRGDRRDDNNNNRNRNESPGSNRYNRYNDNDVDRNDRRERWDNDDRPSASYGGGGGYGWRDNNRYGRDNRRENKRSETGTGWDVRDGRVYVPENESDVFVRTEYMTTGINFDTYDNIPVDINGVTNQVKIDDFRDADVHNLIRENVKRLKYQRPTPVQKYSIPIILGAHDLMSCAQTGSGKTAAFLVPVVARMLTEPPPPLPAMRNRGSRRCRAYPVGLLLAPTRELASQIFEETKKWCFNTGIRAVVAYGGSDIGHQIRDLDNGCDVLVACPGRLLDLLRRGRVFLDLVKYLVFDEADRMLDMGFEPQIREIVLSDEFKLPHKKHRQTVMFSATFPKEIQALAGEFMNESYVFLAVGRVGSTHEYIVQTLTFVEENDKYTQLRRLCDRQQEDGLLLVFVETKKKADELEHYLNRNQYYATSIHGDRSQVEREEALHAFKTGKCPILVATDVAQRGLDIPNVKHVINFDLPNNVDDYVHRIGRTGRAGNVGHATSFVNEFNRPIFRDLNALLETSGQLVPTWFSNLVKQSTAASKPMGGRHTGGRMGGRGTGRGLASGARDQREKYREYNQRDFNDKDSPTEHTPYYRNNGREVADAW
eukprot:GHVR01092294.1.p1 GENE.GHVR01092294.1~~GHVR01092294.1.p1  ORF type:complete len:650 (-),score=189.04 GHVR01092294.1:73-2022(-)